MAVVPVRVDSAQVWAAAVVVVAAVAVALAVVVVAASEAVASVEVVADASKPPFITYHLSFITSFVNGRETLC